MPLPSSFLDRSRVFRSFLRAALVLLSFLGVSLHVRSAEPAPVAITFTPAEVASMHQALDREWRSVAPKPAPDLVYRTLCMMFINAVGTQWHPERWPLLLDLLTQLQIHDPADERYGNFRWFWSDKGVNDPNAVEFAMQRTSLVWLLYPDRLSPECRSKLAALTDLSIEGIHRHKVPVSYTNVFLVKTWDLIAIGEGLGRPEIATEGYHMLEEWIRYTDHFGVHEYLSPTYVAGDMNPLGDIAHFARRPAGRADAEACLSLLWSDVSANWFSLGFRLGGAHSRDYYYLTGQGGVSKHLRAAGWLPPKPGGEKDETSDEGGVYWKASSWQPPSSVLRPEQQPVPRMIFERWGEPPSEFATNYVGHHFSLASAGESYSYQDKPLTMIWPGDEMTPMLYFIMEGRGDPYGKKTLNAGGHQKTVNMIPMLTSVQRGSEVLFLAWLDMDRAVIKHGKDQVNQLASHLVMPTMDTYWVGGKTLTSLAADTRERLPDGAALVTRRGDVALGIRVLSALRTDGSPAAVELIGDGLADHACRLTVTHDEKKPVGRAVVAFWVRAAEGLDDAGFTAFRHDFSTASAQVTSAGKTLDISVQGLLGRMRLAADLDKDLRLAREGGEVVPADSVLSVNGHDLGRDLLAASPALRTPGKVDMKP